MFINVVSPSSGSSSLTLDEPHSSSGSSSLTLDEPQSSSNKITGVVWTRLAETIDDALTRSLPRELTSCVIEYLPRGPVQNLGDYSPSYLSYESICDAIKPWGEVLAIMHSCINHLFVVKFNRALQSTPSEEGFTISCQDEIEGSPFFLRGIYSNGSSLRNGVFTQNIIAFDLKTLRSFPGHQLFVARDFVQHRKFQEANIPNRISNYRSVYEVLEKTINENEKAEILFCWIREFGIRLLRDGIRGYLLPSATDAYKERIVQNYRENGWQLVELPFPTTVP